ncbi:MAG: sulfotransferase family 2 domain-containing protein [Pseudomonadota bacterium]
MIISHRHRFIFIHCRKTGGSSIARALASHLGADDLHLGTWPEAYRAGVAPNRRAKRDLVHPIAGISYLARMSRNPLRVFKPSHRIDALNGAQRLKYRPALGPSPEHPDAQAIAAWAPQAWQTYYKFCFVRNPYHRVVSDYRWRCHKTGQTAMSFQQYLRALDQRDFSSPVIPKQFDNWPMYTIDHRIAVDFVGRFERFESDVEQVFNQLGLALDTLPHEKKVVASTDYGQWYGRDERALVARIFAREIDQFDYALNLDNSSCAA